MFWNSVVTPYFACGAGVRSFVVSPHADDFDRTLGVIDLIHQAMLDVDAAGVGSRQIPDELFVGRWVLEGVLRDEIEQPLRLGSFRDPNAGSKTKVPVRRRSRG